MNLVRIGSAAVLFFGVAAATAQIDPIAPFTGPYTESFETQTAFQFTHCVQGRVFNNTADLCDTTGNGAHITSGWGFFCSIFPHSGGRLFGSAGGPAEYTFDAPVAKFGGWFGTNAGSPDGVARFYDESGNLIEEEPISFPGGPSGTPDECTWKWNAWEASAGNVIKRVTIIGNNQWGGGFVDMDDMEYDLGGGGQCDPCDTNCDGSVNAFDIQPFVDILSGASGCSPCAADTNDDGSINGFDIQGFVECLGG